MVTLIFSDVNFVLVYLNAQREFGEIMIVNPVTGNFKPVCLSAEMPVNFLQSVAEH
jgi:hypothetical protein